MPDPCTTHSAKPRSVAPRDPVARARYLEELKLAYRRGALRAQFGPQLPNDRVVALVFPHCFPTVVAEA